MSSFSVSVIVPVYNSARFLESAVRSAVNLPQIGEILLIEDGSSDDSLHICKQLEAEHANVRTLTHLNNENRGAGASRNLGLIQASYPYVAFLDADDYYLPNRFERSERIFMDYPDVDGVWEAVGTEVIGGVNQEHRQGKLTTITGNVRPEDLFSILIRPGYRGHFQTNGITIRKSLLEKTGLFDPALRLHQDTDLWIRMAYYGVLVPGLTDQPVAIRRVHDANRIAHSNFTSQQALRMKVFARFRSLPLASADYRYLVRSFLIHTPERIHHHSKIHKILSYVWLFLRSAARNEINLVNMVISRR